MRQAFRLAYGIARADLVAAHVGWGTTAQSGAFAAWLRYIRNASLPNERLVAALRAGQDSLARRECAS